MVKITEVKQFSKSAADGYAVTATAATGYKFEGWYSVTEENFISTNASTTLNLETNKRLYRIFI